MFELKLPRFGADDQEARGTRTSSLEQAKQHLTEDRAKLATLLRRYPLEMELSDHYRAVPASEKDLDLLEQKIDEEIARLSNPNEKLWDRMNLLSGNRS